MRSAVEFPEDDDRPTPAKYNVRAPLSLGKTTYGSVAQRTAWRTSDTGEGPSPYGRRTAGTVISWDDGGSEPLTPRSTK